MYEKYAKLRDKQGVTDYAVAAAIGIRQSVLSDWKAGRYTPKVDKLKRIADFFGVSVEYFIS